MLETHKCCHPANISPPRVPSLKKQCTFFSASEAISVWSQFALGFKRSSFTKSQAKLNKTSSNQRSKICRFSRNISHSNSAKLASRRIKNGRNTQECCCIIKKRGNFLFDLVIQSLGIELFFFNIILTYRALV